MVMDFRGFLENILGRASGSAKEVKGLFPDRFLGAEFTNSLRPRRGNADRVVLAEKAVAALWDLDAALNSSVLSEVVNSGAKLGGTLTQFLSQQERNLERQAGALAEIAAQINVFLDNQISFQVPRVGENFDQRSMNASQPVHVVRRVISWAVLDDNGQCMKRAEVG